MLSNTLSSYNKLAKNFPIVSQERIAVLIKITKRIFCSFKSMLFNSMIRYDDFYVHKGTGNSTTTKKSITSREI